MCAVVRVFDTGEGLSLIRADVLDPSWLDSIRKSHMKNILSAFGTRLTVSVTIFLHLAMGKSRTGKNFVVVSEMVLTFLKGTTYIGRFIKSIQPAGSKIVRYQSPPIQILIVHEVRREAETNKPDSHHSLKKIWHRW